MALKSRWRANGLALVGSLLLSLLAAELLLRLLQEGRLMLLQERHLLVCGQDGPRHRESSCAKDGRCGHLHQRCCKWERERCRAGQRRRRS